MDTLRLYSFKNYLFWLLIIQQYCSAITPLPKGLVTLSNNKKNTTITIPENNQTLTFYIIVPENLNNQKQLENFKTEPLTLFFEWQESENAQVRKQAGQDLALALDDLKNRFTESSYVLIGIGQGGNVINYASNMVKKATFETVIQLLPPIFPFDAKNYTEYAPDKNKIKQLFLFYSEHAFVLAHPTLHPIYAHTYPETVNTTHILLLIDNQHAQQSTLLLQKQQNFLSIIRKISETYPLHMNNKSNFIAHLSTKQPNTDGMVFVGQSESNSPDLKKEQIVSDNYKKRFEKVWGRPMRISLNTGEKARVLNKNIEVAATKS